MPGPAPKPDDQRARRNKVAPATVIEITPCKQPKLPPLCVNGEVVPWPQVTLDWWKMWGSSPLTTDFTDVDWHELAITARMHAQLWWGSLEASKEYRQRVAKFGATPEDRARLRIVFATAEKKEQATPKKAQRRGVLLEMPRASEA